jgi:glycosyltransferase involved in cell wall biosynthesis
MTNKKTILFISALDLWSMGGGKGGPALYKTLNGYASRGWQTFFITGNQKGNGTSNSINENIQVIRFDAPSLKYLTQVRKLGFLGKLLWWLYFQVIVFIKAQKIYSKTKIDIVYGYEIYGVPVARLLSVLWKVPMVSRFQGSILRLVWMNKFLWRVRAWEHLIAFKMASNSDLVIMTNDGSQGDKLLRQMGVKNEKIRFWMNGLDMESFSKLPSAKEARESIKIFNKNVLLSISRLMKLKRVDRIINALPEILKEHPDTILLILGTGPEQDQLEQLTVKLGVKEYVRFEGAVPHSKVPEYLAATDIFLSFYDWSNVGNPLLEAMMAGKCIVTLNNGDTAQFIKNKENGILLEYDQLSKLPEVINLLLSDISVRNLLGANARKFALKNFWSWTDRIDAEIREVETLTERASGHEE